MTKLSQLIERNRRHSDTPYILLLECALPNGVTLQQSLMEDVESIYGVPKDRYEADTSV